MAQQSKKGDKAKPTPLAPQPTPADKANDPANSHVKD